MARYKSVGDGTPFGSINVLMTPEEEAEIDALDAAYAAAQPRKDLIEEIAALERTITPRRRDEAILGIDDGWLLNVRNEIALLRGKL